MNKINHSRAHNPADREPSHMANKDTCTLNADHACLGLLLVIKIVVASTSFFRQIATRSSFTIYISLFSKHSLT